MSTIDYLRAFGTSFETVREDLQDNLSSPLRDMDTKALLTLSNGIVAELTASNIASYKINYAATSGNSFLPGGFVEDTLELSLSSLSEEVAALNFKTSIISLFLEVGIQTTYNGMLYIPLGTFYPTDKGVTEGTSGYVNLKMTDLPPIMKDTFRSEMLSLPCTIGEALQRISALTGITINVSAEDFPNLGIELTETFSMTTTYREVLMYLAEAIGACVVMGRYGEIYLIKLFDNVMSLGTTLDDGYLFEVSQQDSTVKPFQYISIKASKDDLGVTQEVEGVTSECEYEMIDNPLTYGHSEDFLEGLVEVLSFPEFHPVKISFHGRPDIEVGKALEYVYKDTTYQIPICTHVFEYNGGFKTTIEAVGSDSLKVSSDTGTKTQINALKQNINSLIRTLEETQSQISAIDGDVKKIATLTQTAEYLSSTVEAMQGDNGEISTIKQTASSLSVTLEQVSADLKNTQDSLNENQAKLLTYFDFMSDGLIIGKSDSPLKLKAANNGIYILRNDNEEVAYFSDEESYITDATILRRLILGNFEIVPRGNGNLSLRRRVGV